jgi:hypothetical protein
MPELINKPNEVNRINKHPQFELYLQSLEKDYSKPGGDGGGVVHQRSTLLRVQSRAVTPCYPPEERRSESTRSDLDDRDRNEAAQIENRDQDTPITNQLGPYEEQIYPASSQRQPEYTLAETEEEKEEEPENGAGGGGGGQTHSSKSYSSRQQERQGQKQTGGGQDKTDEESYDDDNSSDGDEGNDGRKNQRGGGGGNKRTMPDDNTETESDTEDDEEEEGKNMPYT